MLAIDWLKAEFKTGYTVTPITMVRAEGLDTCWDARPLYGADGKWLSKEERGPECGHQHVQALKCKNGSSAHRHKDVCFHRVHVNVDTPGFHFVCGKFQAKVFADAEAPTHTWRNPNIVPIPRRPKLKPEGAPAKTSDLQKLDGVELAQAA